MAVTVTAQRLVLQIVAYDATGATVRIFDLPSVAVRRSFWSGSVAVRRSFFAPSVAVRRSFWLPSSARP